jgi:hypothetical protein
MVSIHHWYIFLQVSSLELAQLPDLCKDKLVPCIVYIQQIGSSEFWLWIIFVSRKLVTSGFTVLAELYLLISLYYSYFLIHYFLGDCYINVFFLHIVFVCYRIFDVHLWRKTWRSYSGETYRMGIHCMLMFSLCLSNLF